MPKKTDKRQLDLTEVLKLREDVDTSFTIWFNHFCMDGHMKILGVYNFFLFAFLRAHYTYDANWRSFPQMREMKDKLGLDAKTIRKCIKDLCSLDYIRVKWKDKDNQKGPLDYKIVEKIHYKNKQNQEKISGYTMTLEKSSSREQQTFLRELVNSGSVKLTEDQKARWAVDYHDDFRPVLQKNYYNIILGDNNNLNVLQIEGDTQLIDKLDLAKKVEEYQQGKKLSKGDKKKIIDALEPLTQADSSKI